MAQVNLGRVVGYSAYEIAVQEGFVGTEAEWLASLKGADGATGPQGPQGEAGPTYTAGTGISIENNVISATGGSGSSAEYAPGTGIGFRNGQMAGEQVTFIDVDDSHTKSLIANEYGMKANVASEPMDNISDTLGNTLDISVNDLGVWVSNWNDFKDNCPQIKVHITSMAGLFSNVDVITTPGEGGMGGQAYQAMYVNGAWVHDYWNAIPEYTLNLNFVYDIDEETMEVSNVRLESITLRTYIDGTGWSDITGSYDVTLYQISFNKLYSGYVGSDIARTSQLYNDQKAMNLIKETYGAAPGTEEWRVWEEEATIDGGRVDVSIDHDPFNYNDILLIENDEQIGYFRQSSDSFEYLDATTGAISTDFSLSYPDEGTLHLMGADGTYTLRQNYTEQIAPTPFNDAYTPQGVMDDIATLFSDVADIRQVPTCSLADAHKVLTVKGNGLGYIWGTLPQELPSYDSTTIGKVLGVQQKNTRAPLPEGELAWVDKPVGVPDYGRASEGDVLVIDRAGEPYWGAPASGGGDVTIDTRPERPSEGEIDDVSSYTAPNAEGGPELTFDRLEYEYQSNGDLDNPEYNWVEITNASTAVDNGGMSVVYEDSAANTHEQAQYGSNGIDFNFTEVVEVPGEEGEDPTTETTTEDFNWCPDHIQLRDQTSGDIYQLTISNGQIVLTNLSL